MPTGYTADVQSGKVTEFRDFALQCARAFGALVTMRDEPWDAPIPDEFKPSDYHEKALAEAQQKLAELRALTPEEAQARAVADWAERCRERARWRAEKQEQAARYQAMLEKAKAWRAPTAEHVEFKQFMVKQLEESLAFDCSLTSYDDDPPREDGRTWLARQREEVERSLARHAEEHAREVERAKGRTEWVGALKSSL